MDGMAAPTPGRGRILRMAALYSAGTVIFMALVILALVHILGGDTGYLVMFIMFGILSLMTGYWMYQYVRDIGAELTTVEGEVQRKWHKSNLLFFFLPSFYIRVERKIFTIPRLDYASLLETDLVRIHCFPHSLSVELVERYDEVEKRFVLADVGSVR
jgi:hypothetical protein